MPNNVRRKFRAATYGRRALCSAPGGHQATYLFLPAAAVFLYRQAGN